MNGMWFETAMFYGIDIRRFQDSDGDGFGDLCGLTARLDYLKELGVDALWLLPFFDTPLRDNGYDIQDYYRIDPRVGTLEDFADLVTEAHRRDIRLIIDLVMNHTSDQHPWFQASRRDQASKRDPVSRYRDYYVWSPEPLEELPGAGTVFPGEEDGIWQYDPVAQAYYLHRFYHFQPDLRIANPDVQAEIFKAVDFWLAHGVDGFRFDAAPLMVEEKGWRGNQPEDPHRLFQDLHAFITARNPDAVLLAEANVELEHMDRFFGGGSEMNMLFNFMLGPYIFLALARGDAGPLRDYMERLLVPPPQDAWLDFLRNHDEMTMDKLSPEQRQEIFVAFAPDPDMRIYDRGVRRRLTPMLSDGHAGMNRARVELAFSLMFSSPGTPLIMYGDELGMGDNLDLPGREAARVPMQWNREKNAGFSSADRPFIPVVNSGPYGYQQVNLADQQSEPGSFWHFMRRLIAVNKEFPATGLCPIQVLEPAEDDPRLLVTGYAPPEDGQGQLDLILFHNLSEQPLSVTLPLTKQAEVQFTPRFGKGQIRSSDSDRLVIELPALGYLWVKVG